MPPYSESIKNEWEKGVFLQTEMLKGNIGSELDKKAQWLNDSLCSLLKRNVVGIILDLRPNGGGAMYPMMLVLNSFLKRVK